MGSFEDRLDAVFLLKVGEPCYYRGKLVTVVTPLIDRSHKFLTVRVRNEKYTLTAHYTEIKFTR